jgi:glycosyltransferase involved in cell wall biosynthesis
MTKHKVSFIGHGYHKKTESHNFVLDYLKVFFDVDEYYDHSWSGKERTDFSEILPKNYDTIIFWQIMPETSFLGKAASAKVVFFPMFDNCDILPMIKKFDHYRRIRVICFSQSLHQKMMHHGFQSHHIRYFPKPKELSFGNENEVFFWQRLSNLNINIAAKILEKFPCKLHLHKAVDPLQNFISPSPQQEQKFQITYSDWIEDKSEFHNLMKDKAIYIAPRFREGVGMSYLEAMAMGKVVIANDNSTMNEYIIHGKTGFYETSRNLIHSTFPTSEKCKKMFTNT